jgi:hypothetical protein
MSKQTPYRVYSEQPRWNKVQEHWVMDSDNLMVEGTRRTDLTAVQRLCDDLNTAMLKQTSTHTGFRHTVRGKCEKCNTPTNWRIQVVDRHAYWCGCD